jgi:hypothetical protein
VIAFRARSREVRRVISPAAGLRDHVVNLGRGLATPPAHVPVALKNLRSQLPPRAAVSPRRRGRPVRPGIPFVSRAEPLSRDRRAARVIAWMSGFPGQNAPPFLGCVVPTRVYRCACPKHRSFSSLPRGGSKVHIDSPVYRCAKHALAPANSTKGLSKIKKLERSAK